ncbi:MAG: HAMP domain-containing histidine kinase [Prevotella sp.]|nr:HAMP domain-containing histidine kinase [Prevotella sp.]
MEPNVMIIFALAFLICAAAVLVVMLIRSRSMMYRQRKEMDRLRRLSEEARQESKAKDLFVQNMSHEVRTPLNAVVGFAQLLAMPPEFLTQEERDEYAQHIQHNSNMLTMLIDDILNISDLKTGNYSITLNDHRLNAVCNTAIASVKYRVKSEIRLTYETDIPDDYLVYTDARRVQQILINYLTNAIKHTQAGSITLSTSLTEHPGMVTFAVTDTGEGVPVGQAKNIFHRFTKLNDYVQGTGLGLNICLTLANKLHGDVFLDTSYTQGARFVFCLPIEKK